MDNIDKNLNFICDDKAGNDNFETLFVQMEDDTIIFRWIKQDIGKDHCSTYVDHQYCGGNIHFKEMANHKLVFCISCGLRKKLPLNIITIRDFKEYCEKIEVEEVSREELLDLDLE